MTASTRSDLLFVALFSAAVYALGGLVPAAVAGSLLLFLAVGWRGPVDLLRRGAAAAWDGLRDVGAVRGASVGLRWLVVAFLAGVVVGRGGIAIPRIVLPDIDWPVVVVPDDDDDPAPEPTGPLTAVVVYETTEPILASERDALYGEALATYVSAHFAKRGDHPEWRILDDDETDLSEESGEIQSAYATAKSTPGQPRIAIRRDGKPVFAGELPDDEASILSLLKKYGGA